MRFSVSRKPLIVLTAAALGLQTWIILLPPLVLEDLRRGAGFTDLQYGQLFSAISLGSVLASLAAGVAGNHLGHRKTLRFLLALTSCMTIPLLLKPTAWLLWWTLLGVTLSAGASITVGAALMIDLFPHNRRRGSALLYANLGFCGLVQPIIILQLQRGGGATAQGRLAWALYGGCLAVGAIVFLIALFGFRRGDRFQCEAAEHAAGWKETLALLRNPLAVRLALAASFHTLADSMSGAWLVPHLTRGFEHHPIAPAMVAAMYGGMYLVVRLILIFIPPMRNEFRWIWLLASGACVCNIILVRAPSFGLASVAYLGQGLFAAIELPLLMAGTMSMFPKFSSGIMGLYGFIGGLLNTVVFLFAGWMVETTGKPSLTFILVAISWAALAVLVRGVKPSDPSTAAHLADAPKIY